MGAGGVNLQHSGLAAGESSIHITSETGGSPHDESPWGGLDDEAEDEPHVVLTGDGMDDMACWIAVCRPLPCKTTSLALGLLVVGTAMLLAAMIEDKFELLLVGLLPIIPGVYKSYVLLQLWREHHPEGFRAAVLGPPARRRRAGSGPYAPVDASSPRL